MKDLMIFNNEEFGKIRTTTEGDKPYLCLSDLCKILEIKNTSDCKSRLNPKGIVIVDTLTKGGKQPMIYIDESNLYKVIFQSRKPEAEKFTEWVTSEVLPQIRETGSYNNSNNKLFAKLTECQIETSYNLVGLKRQLDETANIITEHDKLLKERVYISPSEARNIQKAVYERAKIIAIDNNIPYKDTKQKLFQRLYSSIKDMYEVATYRELPSYKYLDVLEAISKTNVYTADLQCECGQISL